jgi:CRP/FNR family transcriptional regulator
MQFLVTSLEERIQALRDAEYFRSLDDAVLAELAKGVSLRHYETGEIVCWFDEDCQGLYIVRRGSVKLFRLSAKGRELIIQVFSEGATFNEVPVLDRGKNAVNVAALEPCDVWMVDKDVLRDAIRCYPELAESVILNLASTLRMLVTKVEELSFFQVTNRLARLICELPTDESSGKATRRITQDQLAGRLGTVREVVARSLRELERSGAIQVERRQIYVLNECLLMDWAQVPE